MSDSPGSGAESEEGPSTSRLARSSALMASGTFVSRILGLVRTALLVGVIGTTASANAWETANTLPNTIYILLAGGILNTVFVPQLTRSLSQEDKGRDLTDRLITLTLVALLSTTVVVTAGAYLVTKLYALDWSGAQLALAVAFAYLCLPQVFFYGLYAVLGQILNAQEKFGWYMWAPVANNIVAITGLIVFSVRYSGTTVLDPDGWSTGMVLLIGGTATLGVLAQAAVLVPPVIASGFRYRPRWGFRGVGLGAASRMAKWTVAIILVSQAGLLASTNLLNSVTSDHPDVAGRAVFNYAFLIFILPHSLVATSLLTAMFPALSRAAAADDREALGRQYGHGLRLLATAMVPMSIGVLILAPQIAAVILIFSGADSTGPIADVVRALVLGLVPYGVYLLSQRVFHAYQEGRPPFRLQATITAVTVVFLGLALLLPPELTAVTVGLGQSAGQVVAAILAVRWVRRRIGEVAIGAVRTTYLRALAAALLAAIPLIGVVLAGDRLLDGKFAALVVLVTGGAVYFGLYGVLAHWFGLREISDVLDPLLRRLRRRRSGPQPDPPPTSPQDPGRSPAQDPPPSPGSTPSSAPSPSPTSPPHDRQETGPDAGGAPGVSTPEGPGARGAGSEQEREASAYRAAAADPRGAGLRWDSSISPTAQQKEPAVRGIDTGTVLADRYVLQELLARRDESLDYWSATDRTLDRLVAVTVLPATGEFEEMAHAVLDGARRTAGVDDPRLVRVLDVGLDDGYCWIVEEGLSEAESLASLVAQHPLPAEEARRLVGETASGLESARRRGLHHLYLNPHAVLRTSEGSVKVSGIGVAAAIEQVDDVTADEASLIDTGDLLSLLYTGLTGRWPGEEIEGLRAARRLADGTLPAPSEVVSGVPGDLDALCRMTFGTAYAPDQGARTPGELARQLAPWPSEMVAGTGGQDFAPDSPLEELGAGGALAGAAGAGAAITSTSLLQDAGGAADDEGAAEGETAALSPEPDWTGQDQWEADSHTASPPEDRTTVVEPAYYRTEAASPGHASGAVVPEGAAAVGASAVFADDPSPDDDGLAGSTARRPAERRQSGVVLALIAAILVVAVFLAYGAFQGIRSGLDGGPADAAGPGASAGPSSDDSAGGEGGGTDAAPDTEAAGETTDGSLEPIELAGITSYDPEGDGDEHNDLVDLAIDGDPGTAWQTHRYLAANWGNLKSGVGLLVDLGTSQPVSEVDITFPEGDYAVEVYVTDEETREGAPSIGALDDASGQVTFTADEPATGRYVLIWFSRAWAGPDGEVVYVSEVSVK